MRVVRCGVSKADLFASFVAFLVALPLCVGVAIASGVPAELGLVTGIVGGLVVGVLSGSSLRVSGPAVGLTVLVYEAVRAYGIKALGVLVFAAGVVQLGLGVLRLGRWFRAVSAAVVHGMLAGIGLVLVAGQVYPLGDVAVPAGGVGKLAGLVSLPGRLDALEALPCDRVVRLELGGLGHVDHACAAALEEWVGGREMGRGSGPGRGEGVTAVRGG